MSFEFLSVLPSGSWADAGQLKTHNSKLKTDLGVGGRELRTENSELRIESDFAYTSTFEIAVAEERSPECVGSLFSLQPCC
jgi:hypothetical protein